MRIDDFVIQTAEARQAVSRVEVILRVYLLSDGLHLDCARIAYSEESFRVQKAKVLEDAHLLVEGSRLTASLVVWFALAPSNLVFNALSCFGYDIYNTANGLCSQSEDALADAFSESKDAFLFSALYRLGYDASHSRENRDSKAFESFSYAV